MQAMIDNYINGNLTDAKRQAKGFSFMQIRNALTKRGYSANKADATAFYLKTGNGFQLACDAD